jgi:hypothetical protein
MVRNYSDLLRAAGVAITHDWTAQVIPHAERGGTDRTLDPVERLDPALLDLAGVAGCDVFWLLMPARPSFGAGVEFAHALRPGRARVVVVSGPHALNSIFTELAQYVFHTHDEARVWIARRALRG